MDESQKPVAPDTEPSYRLIKESLPPRTGHDWSELFFWFVFGILGILWAYAGILEFLK